MSLFAIGDLHLSLSADKPMDIFGDNWRGHTEKLRASFSRLNDDDLTVLCGDLSWGMSLEEMTARCYKALHAIIMDMMESGLTHCAVITHGGIISNMLSCFGLPKYDAKTLSCDFGMGFDIIVTAQMWLNSQAFEILGYCPYDRLPSEEDE